MKAKVFGLLMSFLVILSLVLVSCGTKTTPTTTQLTTTTTTSLTTIPTTKTTTVPTTSTAGNWWDQFGKPKYDGTLTIRSTQDMQSFDPYFYGSGLAGDNVVSCWLETLGTIRWDLDRNVWNYKTRVRPVEYRTGLLAESYEQPDLATVIFHLYKGITYQDKPPANGREFTANDIVYHFNRMVGLGDGFTKPTPYRQYAQYESIASVTATDQYTVVFKYKQPSIDMLDNMLDNFGYVNIVCKEVVQQYGDMKDWHRAVGTGPFMLQDYVSGVSLDLIKNPNYWGHDERYPQNQLPYIQSFKVLQIPDNATAYAGLRTGKVDIVGVSSDEINWEDASGLAKTNPELIEISTPLGGVGIGGRVDHKPFDDIRVRKALNMAIDRDTIAKTYYGGTTEGIPYGQVNPILTGYYTPYNQWPADIKAGYTYNPEGAKKLLSEAGYPSGFKTNVVTSTIYDVNILQVAKAYFLNIGVDLEIRVMDNTSYVAFTQAGKHDQMVWTTVASINPPRIAFNERLSTHATDRIYNVDPVYADLLDKFYAATTSADSKKIAVQLDDYIIAHFWTTVVIGNRNAYRVTQPWLKGYSGEYYNTGHEFARWFVDQDLKKSMGH